MKSCISKIRELINKPILNSLLSKDLKKWHHICGAVDSIEDAQSAIDSYVYLDKNKLSYIGPKLVISGLFQWLYVQQDSVSQLCESMGIDFKIKNLKIQHPDLYEIRQLRDKGFGHPSKQGEMNSKHVMSIGNDSIQLYSYTETWQSSYPKYKISDCIEKQDKSLGKILRKIINKVRSMEKEHKEKYRQYKLRDCFPADLQYCFNKIILSISLIEEDCGTVPKLPDHGQSTALCNAKDLLEAIDRFEGEIQKRELQDNDSDMVIVRLEIKGSKYPIEKLKEYFRPYSKSHLNAQDAFAYADSAKVHMLGLIDRAKWLDYEYARKH